MRWIDSHCHLDLAPEAVSEWVSRAKSAHLVHALAIGQFESPGNFGNSAQVVSQHDNFFSLSMGIHPHEAANATLSDLELLRKLCGSTDVVAVGEAGLDYHYLHSPEVAQRQILVEQCRLAREVAKPLILHVREAHAQCLKILRDEQINRGVVHCFTGDTAEARQYLELGFYLSLSGIVTYKKTDALQEAVRFIPLDRLMVETDSPFLAPVPHRGKKNEPAWVVEVARKVAELKGVPLDEVAEATTQNAARLFGFKI